MVRWFVALTLAGCGTPAMDVRSPSPSDEDTASPDTTTEPTVPTVPTEPGTLTTGTPTGLLGFIGSPCDADGACHDGGVCLSDVEGFPGGMCTEPCDVTCPDAVGFPTTFCATPDRMPTAGADLGDGVCASRCDFGAYPGEGCREGYGCALAERAGEPGTSGLVCLPNLPDELSDCLVDLVARGVDFATSVVADDAPSDHPELTCHVEDPVSLRSPVAGVEIGYHDAEPSPVLMSCEGAHAVVDSVEDVGPDGVTRLSHAGTYVCRTIAGSDELSRHAYGDAIDITGFTFADGTTWTVYDDWEDGVDAPVTDGGLWLYDTIHRWDDLDVWNVLLTPEYNEAHDDHFHVDLTPGSDFLGVHGAALPPHLTVEGREVDAGP